MKQDSESMPPRPAQRIVAIVGRPNVGKSAIFNRIVGRRLAIVHAQSGVTRDRIMAPMEFNERHFILADTGGLGFFPDEKKGGTFDLLIKQQVEAVLKEAADLCNDVMWEQDILFGRAVVVLAHSKKLNENVAAARKLHLPLTSSFHTNFHSYSQHYGMGLLKSPIESYLRKLHNRTKVVGTFALGTRRLYDFLHENTAVELWSARYVNDPRLLSREKNFVSINATLSVDFLGQCASETLNGKYYSSSGGQSDFARGAAYSEGGQSFIVMQSTAKDGEVSRIVPQLAAGDVVTTQKNTVDKVVTEYGVAELRGRSIRERTRALINIAHPRFRDDLEHSARQLNYL
jgi:hypothetical protein